MFLELTDKNFNEEVLQAKAPTLVDFRAPWCGPCKVLGPIIEELAKEMANENVRIGKLNVDENSETPGRYGVMSIPTLIIFKAGQPVEQLVGVQEKEELKKK